MSGEFKLKFNKTIPGILISLILIIILFRHIDLNQTIKSFGRMNPLFILPIIPVYMLSFVLRAFRWRVLLNNNKLKFSSLLSSIFIGFSLNCVLPARAGEIYRVYFFGKKENLSKTKVFTSVILERIFDGLTLFLILITAICLINPGNLFSKIAFLAGMVFFSGFVLLLALVKMQNTGNKREKIKLFLVKLLGFLPEIIKISGENLINKIFSILNSFIEGLQTLNSWNGLIKSCFYSLLIWLAEGFFMFLVIKSFGINLSFIGVLLVLAVTAFSTLIPAGPAGIGPYQWGYIIALDVFGISHELSLAVSIINQLLIIILILLAGSFFFLKEHIKFDEINQNLEEKQKFPEF